MAGRWCLLSELEAGRIFGVCFGLTILGKTNRPANPLRVGRLDRGALLCITQDKGVRDMDEPMGSMATVKTIEMVEQHAYLKMAELIDGNHLAEARQVAEILKEVGIV